MFINLTIQLMGTLQDIRIDEDQIIEEGIKILQQSGRLSQGEIPEYFSSSMMGTLVSKYKTFKEANIPEGDLLRGM
jgi:hypothetical protein